MAKCKIIRGVMTFLPVRKHPRYDYRIEVERNKTASNFDTPCTLLFKRDGIIFRRLAVLRGTTLASVVRGLKFDY